MNLETDLTKIKDEQTALKVLESMSYHQIVDVFRWLKSPTLDVFACALWRLSNSCFMDYSSGSRLMRDCGYIPYQGLPLQKYHNII